MPRIRVQYKELRRVKFGSPEELYNIVAGTFATADIRDGVYVPRIWYSCRDYFLKPSKRIKRLLFCHRAGRGVGESVATFLRRVERHLKIHDLSVCGPTNHNKIMWIELSPWWRVNGMRTSVFSAMLRAGQNYDVIENNFEEALWSNRYLRQSKYATLRFLKGYTEYTGGVRGWNNQFFWGGNGNARPQAPSGKEVRKLLVKP